MIMTIPRATPIPCSGCSIGELGQRAKGDEWVAGGGGGKGVGVGGGGLLIPLYMLLTEVFA